MSISVLRRIACAIACCAFIVSAGCGTKPEVIRIGAILPLAGAGADVGNQHLHGLQLAIEELNGSNPNIRYELVVDSDQNDPGAALAAFKDQLLKKKILVSFVIARSACLAVVPQAENEFVPVFANCAHPLMISMHLNTFRNVPNTALEIKTMARFIRTRLKLDRAAVLFFNDDAGNDAAKTVKNEFQAEGIRIPAPEPFIADAASITSAVSMARAENPGAICVFGAGKASADLLAALRVSGYRGAVIGSSDFSDPAFVSLAKESLEGCYYPVPEIELTGNAAFADNYRKRFNVEPTAGSMFEYDAMRIVAKAVEIKNIEKINIANALKKIGDFSGPGGNYTYVDREWSPRMSIVQVKAGTPVPVQ
jgi:branched-chain amino acid transport system substrate-binding protein